MLKKFVSFVVPLVAFPLAVQAATVQLPKTGQTVCYDISGAEIPCAGTGQDAELKKGIDWPNPRFIDGTLGSTPGGASVPNGTVTDNLTGLVWLKNADCAFFGNTEHPGETKWADALEAVNRLQSGQCGLTDGSTPGSWRLPNAVELESLIDLSHPVSTSESALPSGSFIENIMPKGYWTSTTHARFTNLAWVVSLFEGSIRGGVKDNLADPSDLYFILPVRNAQPAQ